MSGINRTVAVAVATAGLVGLWAPAALAGTTGGNGNGNGSGSGSGNLIGPVNIGNAVGNTDNRCAHVSDSQATNDDGLGLPLDLIRGACGNSGVVCTALIRPSV